MKFGHRVTEYDLIDINPNKAKGRLKAFGFGTKLETAINLLEEETLRLLMRKFFAVETISNKLKFMKATRCLGRHISIVCHF